MYTTTVPDDLSLLPPSKSWPQQGQWTYDDYLRLPDFQLPATTLFLPQQS